MSEQLAEPGDVEDAPLGTWDKVVYGGILGLLLLVAAGCFVWGGVGPTRDAQALESGRVTRVVGTLERCEGTGRGSLVSGAAWCLEKPVPVVYNNEIAVAWPAFRELERYSGDQVTGLVRGDAIRAFELPNGTVVASADVGWRGTWEMVCIGLAFVWTALRFWRWLALSTEAWEASLLRRIRWWWGLTAIAGLSVHARVLPVAIGLDVIMALGLAVLLSRETSPRTRDRSG